MIAFFRIVSRVPLSYLYLISDFLFFLTFYVFKYRKKVVLSNLRKAFPKKTDKELQHIAKGFYLNLCDVIVEAIRSYSIPKAELANRVKVTNPELLQTFFDQKKSVILCGAHQCNWEWVILGCAANIDTPIDPLYKPLSNKGVDAFMLHIRSRFGQKPIPVGRTLQEMRHRMQEVRMFGFAADQAPPPGDPVYWTTFLTQETGFFMGIEKVAYLLKLPVVFAGIKRVKRGKYEMTFELLGEPPYEKGSNIITERFARATEKQIIEAPSDWLWSHKRWKRPRVFEKA